MVAKNNVTTQNGDSTRLPEYIDKLKKGEIDLTHPYLANQKKFIDEGVLLDAGVRFSNGEIIYPLRTLTSNEPLQVQAISSAVDGNGRHKRFLYGRTDGVPVFHAFGGVDFDRATSIILAESLTKAAAIYQSVRAEGNYIVLNCLNNGGIVKVANLLSGIHKGKSIIAADNDEGKGNANSLGYDTKVYESAVNNNLPICMPIAGLKDWDDWFGINDFAAEEIYDCINVAKPIEVAKITAELDSFEEKLKTKKIKVPFPFILSKNGLSITIESNNDSTEKRITSTPVWIEAISRDHNNESFGKLVCWFDVDHKYHQRAISNKTLFSQSNEIAMLLSDGGLHIVYGTQKNLLEYITSALPDSRLVAAASTGWFGNSFVLPTETINQPKDASIVFQPSGLSDVAKSIHKQGSFNVWKQGLVDAPELMVFSVCASLSASVRYPLNIEGGGFNFFGLSSKGKTTLLQGGASVWGCGTDSAQSGGKSTFIQRFNSTDNALEAKAAMYNDLPMIVDEIGESNSKAFGQLIYRLTSGQGKSRSNRDGNLKDSSSWRTMILSAGELAVTEYIEQSGGSAKGGQIVRLPDIPVEDIFHSAKEADHYKRLFSENYGYAGVEFLKRCSDMVTGFDLLQPEIIGEALTSTSERVRKRFLLVLHAGYLAVEFGVLPWSREEVLSAVKYAYNQWYSQSNSITETDKGISSIRNYLMRFGASRFSQGDYEPIDRAGWLRDDIYYFVPEVFKEACNGSNLTAIKKELHKRGLLHKNKLNTYNSNLYVSGKTISTVAIKANLLES